MGQFQFRRMPFGARCASLHFQQQVAQLLEPLGPYVWNYEDDIVIAAQTFEDELVRLHTFLGIVVDAHLKVNCDKSDLFFPSIKYLGFLVDAKGYSVDPERAIAMASLQPPRDKTTLLSFLGAVNYLSSFVPNCAQLCAPLYALTRRNAEFRWLSVHQDNFERIRAALSDIKMLHHPDPTLPKVLRTDASVNGLGGILLQLRSVNNAITEEPIAHLGRKLTDPEMRCSTTELELLSVIF